MEKFEPQSPRRRYFERIRKWVVLISSSLSASFFWGTVLAAVAKWKFEIRREDALLFIALPTIAIFLFYFYFNRHKLARAFGFDSDI